MDGSLKGSLWCPLLGLNTRDEVRLVGLRHQGFKYFVDIDSGEEWLYSTKDDAPEHTNLVGEEPDLLDQVRRITSPDRKRLTENLE